MKKSEVIKLIEKYLMENNPDLDPKEILDVVLEAGLRPPRRDYIEDYGWKSDNSWEKE